MHFTHFDTFWGTVCKDGVKNESYYEKNSSDDLLLKELELMCRQWSKERADRPSINQGIGKSLEPYRCQQTVFAVLSQTDAVSHFCNQPLFKCLHFQSKFHALQHTKKIYIYIYVHAHDKWLTAARGTSCRGVSVVVTSRLPHVGYALDASSVKQRLDWTLHSYSVAIWTEFCGHSYILCLQHYRFKDLTFIFYCSFSH